VKKLALVTVTYNAEQNLSFFLPSVERNKEMIDGLFFIDNNSSDNTLPVLHDWKKKNTERHIEILSNTKNYGYAHAINTGIQKALKTGCDYILVTNNDIVFNDGMITQMLEDIIESQADVLGIPASVSTTDVGFGYILDGKTLLPAKILPTLRKDVEMMCASNPLPRVDFAHGGTILFTRRFFDEIGLYDDELFFGGDELDFLYRVHAYNEIHEHKISCAVSLRGFLKMDNLTKHNGRHKTTKAKRILQGTARVYLKHRFSPTDLGLYREQYTAIESLAKGKLLRYVVLLLFSLRAFTIEICKYYAKEST
jgi:glycosyltransferase involved in cell wall biosynthesis